MTDITNKELDESWLHLADQKNQEEWEKEFDKSFEDDPLDTKGIVNKSDSPHYHIVLTRVIEMKYFISSLLSKEREKAIDDYLKTDKGKVYLDYKELEKQAKSEAKKEIIDIIEEYFDGLVAIPNPQATKESIIKAIESL